VRETRSHKQSLPWNSLRVIIFALLMRLLAVLGLLGVAGCGLELGGAAMSTTGGGEAPVEDAPSSEDAASLREGGTESAPGSDGHAAETAGADSGGTGPDSGDSGSTDGLAGDSTSSASDSTVDAPLGDAPVEAMSTSGCLNAIPSGWSLVVYDLGTDPCPPNFTAHDVTGPTTIQPGACSCSCSVAQDGNCAQGTLSVHPSIGNNGACDLDAGWSKDLDGSGCTPLGVTLYVSGPHSDLSAPLVPQGGSCADIVQSDPTKFAATSASYCDVPPASADSVCSGTVSSGFAACILTDGETTCPAGSLFAHAYVVQDSATLQCSSCAGCSAATSCSNAVLTGYSDTACSSPVGSVGVDGGCNPVNVFTSPSPLVAVTYTAIASTNCTPGTSTPGAQLVNPRTICCR
jgi:hypothetical protein